MNIESVIEKCKALKLKAVAENLEQIIGLAEQRNWTPLETMDQLFELELEMRRKNKIDRCFKQSRLYETSTIDQFDFNFHISRKNQKSRIVNLMDLEFIKHRKDIILIGNPGVGKSFLAKCMAYNATQTGLKVLFTTAMDMINHLIAAEADHSLLKKLQHYQSQELLVCDEIGYLSLGTQGSNLFFQVISARHERTSTIITTNRPFSQWGEIFDNTTVATAIADRLVYNSEVLILEGPSYRKRKK
ncbi:MAG: IS21-like element helper ATPase IstB [Desulfobacterales bacterium]|nr:IS21-like element helper ATPase IstB [Desulfobacterales bacterium]